MKLSCILTSCNLNKMYCDFIPIFINSWNKLYPTIDVKIILIAKEIPNELKPYLNNLILFDKYDNISTAFCSQFIRLLYPCILKYDGSVMITDIDIIPMNKTYFSKNIENIEDDKFVYLRDACLNIKEIAMCYNVALPNVWQEIFEIYSEEDIVKRLKDVFSKIKYIDGHNKAGWNTDQKILYDTIMKWNENTKRFVFLKDVNTGYNRLCRNSLIKNCLNDNHKKNISSYLYTDYHLCRPYEKYKQMNDEIFKLL